MARFMIKYTYWEKDPHDVTEYDEYFALEDVLPLTLEEEYRVVFDRWLLRVKKAGMDLRHISSVGISVSV